MRLRIFSTAALLLFAVAALPAAQTGGDKKKDPDPGKKDPPKKEPDKLSAKSEINGKTLDQWIELITQEKHKVKDRSQTELAIKTVVLYGPDLAMKAVPAIIGELKKHKGVAKIDMSVRVNGCVALGLILSSAKDPSKDLVKEAVGELNRMLKDDQVIVRFRVAQALAQMGPMASETIPNLVSLTTDFDTWETRHAAVIALATVAWEDKNPADEKAVRALFKAMQDSSVKVRLACLGSLANLRVAKHASYKDDFRKELVKMANGDVDAVCKLRARLMVYPLTEKYADKKTQADLLAGFLTNADIAVRVEMVAELGSVAAEDKAPPHAATVDVLYKALQDKEVVVRLAALASLSRLKVGDFDTLRPKYLVQLEQVAAKDADTVCKIRAHAQIFPQLKGATEKKARAETIGGFVADPDAQVKIEATQALAHLGAPAKDALPLLIKGLGDPDPTIVGWCVFALAHMERAAEPALPNLRKLVADANGDPDVRETAQDAINIITGKEKLKKDEPKKGGDK